MYGEEIAKWVQYGNIVLVCAAIAIAVCGVFVLINRFLKLTSSALFIKENFFTAFCIAAVVALVAEGTVFNFQHHLKHYAGDEIFTMKWPNATNRFITNEGTIVPLAAAADVAADADVQRGFLFQDLNRSVTSIFIDITLNEPHPFPIRIHWTDAMGEYSYNKTINPLFPQDFHTPHQPRGDVRNLIVWVPISHVDFVNSIVLNRQIPLYFSGLRMLVFSLLVFAFIIIIRKNLRARFASFIFDYKFEASNRKQKIVYAVTVVLLIVFTWACVYTSVPDFAITSLQGQHYNKYLVDALIAGRTWLDYGNPEKLLAAERPYDPSYREYGGYEDAAPLDWAWYKGKYYSYFGVVPAILLYVPYKLITGTYLPNHAANAIFTTAIIIFLAMLWRFCVKKYMPNMRFAFYILSFLVLFFACGLFAIIRTSMHYPVLQNAAFMFAVAGAFLLLKSVDDKKVSHIKLFFACLCFAFIAGCRPNVLITPLLFLPVVLWKHRSWKLVGFVTIPFMIVAIPLCIYNYVRFDSIFEFGAKYNLTMTYVGTYSVLNPIGHITNTFINVAYYLFYPVQYVLHFPFIISNHVPMLMTDFDPDFAIHKALPFYYAFGPSIISFPITFCLLYYFSNFFNRHKPKTFHAFTALFIGIVFTLLIMVSVTGFAGRYVIDIFPYFIFPALFCAYYCGGDIVSDIKNNGVARQNNIGIIRMWIVYVLLTITVFVGLFLCVGGARFFYHDPTLYRYLEYSLGIVRDI